MTRYAQNTDVSSDKSLMEIRRTLTRYGCKSFHFGEEGTQALIAFEINDRFFKIVLPLPDRQDFALTPERQTMRSPQAREAAYEQAVRQRWRALSLWIKATLEATESGITTLEEALLPFILLPDKSTVREFMLPQVAQAYETGRMPGLLPALTGPSTHEKGK